MKYWISKYALTPMGIKEIDANVRHISKNGTIQIDNWGGGWNHFEKGEYHATKEAAIAAAEQMRADEISLLKNEIQRLERMEF